MDSADDEAPSDLPKGRDLGASDEEQQERRKRVRRLKQELVGDLLTTAEVAEILEVHQRTVGEYIRDGRLPAINLGGGWKVSEGDLRYFVQQVRPVVARTTTGIEVAATSTPQEDSGGLFSRMTTMARQTIVAAQEHARAMNHAYIGTEHLLLGVLSVDGVARDALNSLGLHEDEANSKVLSVTKMGEAPVGRGFIPFTPRAKRVLEMTLREALRMGNPYISTEHILLALIKEGGGIAAKVIEEGTAGAEVLESRVLEILGGESPEAGNS